MRQDICSIPIQEMFEPKEGCPICRMRDMLESRMVEYIMGAAMMEPDVRVETNRAGFCGKHYSMMREQGNRLSLGLLLETRLQYLEDAYFGGKNGLASPEPLAEDAGGLAALRGKLGGGQKPGSVAGESCFVCATLNQNMENLLKNLTVHWQKEPEFRTLFDEQEYICLPHCKLLCQAAQGLPSKERQPFRASAEKLARKKLDEVQKDVTHFCRMFDYRNKDGDWGNSRDAIERAIAYLTGRPV